MVGLLRRVAPVGVSLEPCDETFGATTTETGVDGLDRPESVSQAWAREESGLARVRVVECAQRKVVHQTIARGRELAVDDD